MGEAQRAYEDLTWVIQADTKDPEIYHSRGRARISLGDATGALADFEQAAELYLQQGMAVGYRAVLDDMAQL